jgi:hypothetical protein
MIRKFSMALLLSGALLLLAVPVLRADSLDVTFSPASATAVAGATTVIDVYGTITNPITNTQTLYLNGDILNVAPMAATSTDFFYLTPVSLDPGQSSGLIELFQIVFGPSIAPGDYVSNYTLEGGTDDTTYNFVSNTASFDVTVPTPEPGTLLLLGSGLAFLVGRRRRASA